MKRVLLTLFVLTSSISFGQTFGTVNMWMAQSSSSVGTTITTTILGQYSLPTTGCPAGAWSITGTAPKVGASQGGLGASLTAGAVLYPSTQPTQSIAFDDGSNFSYIMCSNVPGGSTITIAGYYTPGFPTGLFSVADLVRVDTSTPNAFAIMQLQVNGSSYCIRSHAGTGGDTGSCIPITPLQRIFFNLTAQAGVGTTVNLYNALSFTSIGSSFLASSGTAAIGTPFRWYMGNVEALSSAGHTDFFEAIMTSSATSIVPTGPSQLWSGVLATSRAIDWSLAGVVGGVPSSTYTQCGATIAAYTGSPSTINTRLAGCPVNQYVQLGAGNFNLTDGLLISNKTNLALRGMGADQTLIAVSGGTLTCGGGAPVSACIRATDGNFSGTPSNLCNWIAGYAQGSTALTFSCHTNLKVGNYVILDQLDDDATNCDNGGVYVADIITNCATAGIGTPTAPGVNGPYSGQGNGGGARSNRAQQQIVQIVSCGTSTPQAACTSNSIVISPGLYMPNWRTGQTPQAWWATSPSQYIGIENLSIDNTNNGQNGNACSGGVGIGIYNSPNSWVVGVRDILSVRAHIQILYSPHVTVWHDYLWGTQNRTSCSYGVEVFSSSDSWIAENIVQAVASPLMSNGPDAGTVYWDNYTIFDLYTAGSLFTANMHGDHDAGNGLCLVEGNEGNVINADVIHGTGNLCSYFRNRLTGLSICWQSSTDNTNTSTVIATGTFNPCTGNISPFVVNSFHRFYNLIANVSGTAGSNTGYSCVASSTTTLSCTSGTAYNFVLGEGNPNFALPVLNDVNVAPGTMLWGNVDSATGFGSPRWNCSEVPTALTGIQAPFINPCPASHTLPASFYLAAKPGWWPSTKPWPTIGPDVSGGNVANVGGHVFTNPAHDCAIAIGILADGTNTAPSTFNANTCYGSSPPPQVPSPASGLFATISKIDLNKLTLEKTYEKCSFIAIAALPCGTLPSPKSKYFQATYAERSDRPQYYDQLSAQLLRR